jgi:hypothetical protein
VPVASGTFEVPTIGFPLVRVSAWIFIVAMTSIALSIRLFIVIIFVGTFVKKWRVIVLPFVIIGTVVILIFVVPAVTVIITSAISVVVAIAG